MTIHDNIVKECQEEAGVSREMAAKCIPAGAVSYFSELPRGLSPEIQFVFDLQLPHDFVPKAMDGEVGAFYHLTVEEVMKKIVTPEYKPNCAMVLLDFFMRKGIISPDNQKKYLEILVGMHVDLYHLDFLRTAPSLDS
jgi:hypothetical protein